MKKIFSKKLLFILLFFLFLIFSKNYVFSFSSVTSGSNLDGEKIYFADISTIDTDYNTAIVYKNRKNGNLYLVFSNSVYNNKGIVYPCVFVPVNADYIDSLSTSPYKRYKFNGSTWEYYDEYSKNISFSNADIYYSSIDLYDISTNPYTLMYKANYDYSNSFNNFNITLSTTEKTNNPVIAYTNYFDYADAKKYKCYISTDAKNWYLMNYETFNNTTVGSTQFRFNYKILKNDTYYFKLLDTETNEEKYITVVVANILKNSTNSGFNEYGIPQPFLTYKRVNDEFIIKTQNFTLEDIQKYQGLYVKDSDFVTDYSQWQQMILGSYNNTQLNQTEYYFYIKVPKNSENCIYYFVFYDYNQQKYGSPSSLNCDFTAMNEYVDKVSGVTEKKKTKFEELIEYFRERFGFLTYPFEFISNLFNRFLTIQFEEPILDIPDIYEPFTNSKIISAKSFNLNSILENNIFKTIHNYYLLFVDAFVYIGIINLIRLKCKEVFSK